MATSRDFEVEGVTAFAAPPAPDYRYVISVKDEKINIWMEDRSSKKQWQSEVLSKEGFITTANAFADASVADYVSCFQQSLDYKLGESADAQRQLTPLLKGMLFLKLSVKIRVLRSARDVSYTFELQPIAVERIDIMESKLRDQQEELEKLRAAQETEKATKIGCICLQSSSKELHNKPVTWGWRARSAQHFKMTIDGAIEFRRSGLYSVVVALRHFPTGTGSVAFELRKDGTCLQADEISGYSGFPISTTFQCVTQIEEGGKMMVMCMGIPTRSVKASFMATRIGP